MPTFSCKVCKKEITLDTKISFREDCNHCGADLHSCIHCGFYDTSAYNECHETSADRVVEKEKANYCEYFVVNTKNGDSANTAKDDAKSKLDDLFK
jgi:hypothetical protein